MTGKIFICLCCTVFLTMLFWTMIAMSDVSQPVGETLGWASPIAAAAISIWLVKSGIMNGRIR